MNRCTIKWKRITRLKTKVLQRDFATVEKWQCSVQSNHIFLQHFIAVDQTHASPPKVCVYFEGLRHLKVRHQGENFAPLNLQPKCKDFLNCIVPGSFFSHRPKCFLNDRKNCFISVRMSENIGYWTLLWRVLIQMWDKWPKCFEWPKCLSKKWPKSLSEKNIIVRISNLLIT